MAALQLRAENAEENAKKAVSFRFDKDRKTGFYTISGGSLYLNQASWFALTKWEENMATKEQDGFSPEGTI